MESTFFIQDVYRITGVGPVIVGQVKSGALRIGMKLNVSGRVMTVKKIQMHHKGPVNNR